MINIRKFLISSILICSSIFIEAQNNLVFNEVLNFKVIPGAEVIVPENKVWKVEYLNTNDLRASNTETAYGVNLNNTVMYENISGGNAIWFSAGTILTSPNVESIVSILEFNLVPISSSGDGSGGGNSAGGDGFVASGSIINLEFTAINNTGNIGSTIEMGSITVPDGKIWKLMTYSYGCDSNPNVSYGGGYGGKVLVDGFILGDGGAYYEVYLSSGTYPVHSRTNASGGGGTYYILAKIGGIEYNAN